MTDPRAGAADLGTPTGPSAEAVGLDESGHATRRWCSWADAGWRSVLLRELDNHAVVDETTLPATDDQLLVLVVEGRAEVSAAADSGRWTTCHYGPGRLAMTASGRPVRLRWRTTSPGPHRTLHLYLPTATLQDTAQHLWGRDLGAADLPDTLGTTDPLVEATMRALAEAGRAGADDLYAESATQFLAVHLLERHTTVRRRSWAGADRADARIRRVVDHMHDNLSLPLSLGDLAAVADLSPYHFLRLFRATVGEPPHRHLTRLRVEMARRRLERGDLPVSDVAYLCGFSSPAHLTTAYRRWTGSSPADVRRSARPGS